MTRTDDPDVLRTLFQEWSKGNMWALADVAHPDIEWEWSESLASLSGGPRVYRGLEEIGATTREWLEAWDFYWMTAEEFVDAGEGVIVVFMTLHARTRASGSVLEQPLAAVWTLREGRVLRVRYYEDRQEALEAAGLS